MSTPSSPSSPVEPERYELDADPGYRFDFSRREFLKTVGGGIAVVCVVDRSDAQVPAEQSAARNQFEADKIGAWLHIGEDGRITAYTGKVELGQNTRTMLSQVAAEELRVPAESIHLVMGDTHLTPYDRGTWGSLSTPTMVPKIRQAAAAARALLIELANATWTVDPASIYLRDGRVLHPDRTQSFAFGELTRGRDLVKAIDATAPATTPSDWEICGAPIRKVNGLDMVTGRHRFASDISLPGMLHGKILRPRAFGATLTALDLQPAEAMNGITVVRDGDFVGVAAETEEAATRALARIDARWDTTRPQPSQEDLYRRLKGPPPAGDDPGDHSSIGAALRASDHRLKQTYTVAYIAHAPLEPRVAVARWTDGNLDVWMGAQSPFGVRSELASTFRIPEHRVRVRVPDTGAGFGGKIRSTDVAVEAARLSRAAGKPVKVMWTREEEFTWAYFRPAGVLEVESGATQDGQITAWRFHNYNSGSSAIETPYRMTTQEVEFHRADSPLNQGSYRALAATANHFARESHMDEIAHELHRDPLDLRLRNLDDPRLIAVLRAAAKQFGWETNPAAPNRGVGMACGATKGCCIATFAEVIVDPLREDVRVERIVSAFECGAILNPHNVENQVLGTAVMGLGGALFEAIEFAGGRILNPTFSKYRVPRFSDTPVIETVLVDRKDVPSAGAGEIPLVCIAPAIGNAIFNATGVRLCSLPLLQNGLNPQRAPIRRGKTGESSP